MQQKLYDNIVQQSSKPHPNYNTIKDLLDQEFQTRQNWISKININKKKPNKEKREQILSRYQCFGDYKHVSQSFR